MTQIYLDYAAATPMADEAIEAIQPYLQDVFYNPSAIYQSAREVRRAVERARSRVAQVLGSKEKEIIFTAGGTEANNLAIQGIMNQHPDGEILVSSIEHESVLEPASVYRVKHIPVDPSGIVDVTALSDLITEKTVLVSVMYANNEIGTIQPIKRISAVVEAVRIERKKRGNQTPIYLHTDACQAANYLDLHVSRSKVDLMTLNGGKIYAMKQSGCLYIRSGTELDSLIKGGGQEDGLRSGTENVGAIHSFATMLQKVQQDRKVESDRLTRMRDELLATLSQKHEGITLNGHPTKRLPNNLNIAIAGVDGERLVMELDEAGLMVATGSACTASNDEPSHVLRACGLSIDDANSSLRVTLGRNTTKAEIARASEILSRILKQHAHLV